MAEFDWKSDIYVIAAIIYVGGMFPLFYLYETDPSSRFGLISNVSYIAIFGAMLLFLQLIVGAWYAKEPPVQKTTQDSPS